MAKLSDGLIQHSSDDYIIKFVTVRHPVIRYFIAQELVPPDVPYTFEGILYII